jgi:hypothetical protein
LIRIVAAICERNGLQRDLLKAIAAQLPRARRDWPRKVRRNTLGRNNNGGRRLREDVDWSDEQNWGGRSAARNR